MWRLLRILLLTLLQTMVARLRRGPLLPSWSFQFEWVTAFLRRDFSESARWPPQKLRADLDSRRYPSAAAKRVTICSATSGSVPSIIFTPTGAAANSFVLFFHGGSYQFGSPRTTHRDLLARLALATSSIVIAPDYRLAPEHPYPAQLEDALRAFETLKLEHSNSRIILVGDSAGGNLALSLQLALRDRSKAQAAAAALISPWLELSASRPSCSANEAFDYGQTGFLLRHARQFAGELPLNDPRISPIHAELNGLSPLFVQIGGAERLRDEGVELHERALRAGVDSQLDLLPELPHLPPIFADFHPAGAQALDNLARYIRARLGV